MRNRIPLNLGPTYRAQRPPGETTCSPLPHPPLARISRYSTREACALEHIRSAISSPHRQNSGNSFSRGKTTNVGALHAPYAPHSPWRKPWVLRLSRVGARDRGASKNPRLPSGANEVLPLELAGRRKLVGIGDAAARLWQNVCSPCSIGLEQHFTSRGGNAGNSMQGEGAFRGITE